MKSESRSVADCLRSMFAHQRFAELCDSQVLARFIATRDSDAFSCLMRRHGPMVLSLARRIVRDHQLAEDVFQATFLVLARQPRAVRGQESLPAWLHRVAFRLAVRAKKSRQNTGPQPADIAVASSGNLLDELSARELLNILDEELNRLPEKYRVPLVLCHLEGLTREQAAQRLGVSVGTVKGMLERGVVCLRTRLAKRGLTGEAGFGGSVLLMQVPATVSPLLVQSTLKAAMTSQGASLAAAGLAKGAITMMFLAKLRYMCVPIILLGAVGWGARLVAISEFFAAERVPATPVSKVVAPAELPEQGKPPALAKDFFGNENDAEKLYRTMEKAIRAAKSLKVVCDLVVFSAERGQIEKAQGTVQFAPGNKTLFEISGKNDNNTGGFGMVIQSDGKEKVVIFAGGFVLSSGKKPTEPYLNEMLESMIARVGIMGTLVTLGSIKEFKDEDAKVSGVEFDKILPASAFKWGAKASVGDVEIKVIEYNVIVAGQDKFKIRLWIDPKTMLPLRRHIVDESTYDVMTEIYSEFALDPVLDMRLFEWPK